MSDWVTMFPNRGEIDGSPIRGLPDEFQAAGDFFADMETASLEATEQFERLQNEGGADEFQGETAVAFTELLGEVNGSLSDLPRVSGEAHVLLHAHAPALTGLRERAETGVNSALARAQTHWGDKNAAEIAMETHSADARMYLSWIAWADSQVDCEDLRANYVRMYDNARAGLTTATGNRDTAQGCLDMVADEWVDLRTEEDDLSKALDKAIDDIRLGDLSDPGRMESFCNSVAGFVTSIPLLGDIIEAAYNLVEAVVTGDMALFLHSLSDLLGGILTIAAFVALFTPIGPFVAVALFAAASIKFAVDAYLYDTGTPNPKTGDIVTAGDLALSAVTFAGAGAGTNVALSGAGGTISVFGNSMNTTTSVFAAGATVTTTRGAQATQVVSDVAQGVTYTDVFFGIAPGEPSFEVSQFDIDIATPGSITGNPVPGVTFDFDVPVVGAGGLETDAAGMSTTSTTTNFAPPPSIDFDFDLDLGFTQPVIVPVDVDVNVVRPPLVNTGN